MSKNQKEQNSVNNLMCEMESILDIIKVSSDKLNQNQKMSEKDVKQQCGEQLNVLQKHIKQQENIGTKVNQLVNQVHDLEQRNSEQANMIKYLTASNERIQKDKDSQSSEKDLVLKDKEQMVQDTYGLKQEVSDLKAQVENLDLKSNNDKLMKEKLQLEIDQMNQKIQRLQLQLTHKEEEVQVWQKHTDEHKQKVCDTLLENEVYKNKIDNLFRENNEQKQQLEQCRLEIEHKKTIISELVGQGCTAEEQSTYKEKMEVEKKDQEKELAKSRDTIRQIEEMLQKEKELSKSKEIDVLQKEKVIREKNSECETLRCSSHLTVKEIDGLRIKQSELEDAKKEMELKQQADAGTIKFYEEREYESKEKVNHVLFEMEKQKKEWSEQNDKYLTIERKYLTLHGEYNSIRLQTSDLYRLSDKYSKIHSVIVD